MTLITPRTSVAVTLLPTTKRRNRVAGIAISGLLLVTATVGIIATTAHAAPASSTTSVSVQLPTE